MSCAQPEDVGCLPDGADPARHSPARNQQLAAERSSERRGLTSAVPSDDADEDEDYLDGGSQSSTSKAGASSLYAPESADRDYTLREALRTSALYLLNCDTLVGWMFGGATH